MSRTRSTPVTRRACSTTLQMPEWEQPVTITSPSSPRHASAESSGTVSSTTPSAVLRRPIAVQPSKPLRRSISPRKTRRSDSHTGSRLALSSKCRASRFGHSRLPSSGTPSASRWSNSAGWATSCGRRTSRPAQPASEKNRTSGSRPQVWSRWPWESTTASSRVRSTPSLPALTRKASE